MSEDALIVGLEELDPEGASGFLLFHAMIIDQVRDIRVSVERVVEAGEWVAAATIFRATGRSNGLPVAIRAHTMARIVDGKIVEGLNLVDFIALFEQLRLLPPRTLDLCLMGRRPIA